MIFRKLVSFRLILELVGIQFVTAVLMSSVNSPLVSRYITLPFRFVVFALTLFILIFGKKSFHITKLYLFYLVFLVIYVSRILIDLFFGNVVVSDQQQLLMFIFLIEIPSLAVLISTWRLINFTRLFNFIYVVLLFSTFYVAFTKGLSLVYLQSLDTRVSGSVALSTISLGHMAVSLIALALVNSSSFVLYNKVIAIIAISVGLLVLLASGSKGPIFSLICVLICRFIWGFRRWHFRFLFTIVMFSVLLGLTRPMLSVVKQFVPYLGNRLISSVENMDLGGRDHYYESALRDILDSPFLGPGFQIKVNGKFDYAHNIFLDIVLGLGFGGLLFFVVLSVLLFKKAGHIYRDGNRWIPLLFIQYFTFHLWSGAFYMDPLFILLVGIICLYEKKRIVTYVSF